MIGGILDGLMGKNSFQARAPRIDTRPGQKAIQTQAQLGGDQALSQAYSLAASGRSGGAGGALAMREAQRRGAEATASLQSNAVSQQQALQQAANQQQAQAEMQAQQINAQIAQQNAGGMQRLAGLALMGGALAAGGPMGAAVAGGAAGGMASDRRQKEMLSDFTSKEPVGRFGGVDFQIPEYAQAASPSFPMPAAEPVRPAPARTAFEPPLPPAPHQRPDASAGAAAFGLNRPRQPLPSLYDAARARNMADPHYTPPAQYLSQPVRSGVDQDAFSNRAIADHLRARGEQLDMQAMQDPNERAAMRTEVNDRRSRVDAKRASDQEAADMQAALDHRREIAARLMEGLMTQDPPEVRMTTQQAPGFSIDSDFRQKESLDPVRPTLYRYNPESSHRQALEAAQQTYATTLEDKRAPRMGIVAQDLQQSTAFAPSVVQKDDGQLAVDKDRALSAALAELGGLHRRVKKLEKGGRKRGA